MARAPSKAVLPIAILIVALFVLWPRSHDGQPEHDERRPSTLGNESPTLRTPQAGAPPGVGELRMPRARGEDAPGLASISGTVQDGSGRPVPHATVVAIDEHGAPAGQSHSGAAGRFEIASLAPGAWALTVLAVGYAPCTVNGVRAPGSTRIVLDALATLRFEIRLPKGAALPSHVKVSSTPLQGGSGSTQTVAGEDGRFEMARIPIGRLELRIDAAGYPTCIVRREVEPGETVDLGRLDLAEGSFLSGRVVDALGEPVQWLEVRVEGTASSTYTGRDGEFRLGPVQPADATIRVVGGMRFLDRLQPVDARADVASLLLQMDRGALVTGQLTRATGSPEPGPAGPDAARTRCTLHLVTLGPPSPREELVDRGPQGRFVMRLRPARYRLELRSPDGKVVLWERYLDLREGRDERLKIPLPSVCAGD